MKSPSLLNISIRKEYSRTPEPADGRYNYQSRSISKQNNRFVLETIINDKNSKY